MPKHAQAPGTGGPSLRLILEGTGLTIDHLEQVTAAFGDIVREVSGEVSQSGPGAVAWMVSDARLGSFELEVRAVPAKQTIPASMLPEIVTVIVDGMASLQDRPERPRHFNDSALRSARVLGSIIGPDVTAVRLKGNGTVGRPHATVLTKQVVANVDEVIGTRLESYGTVEGVLEAITVHGKRAFAIYEPLTNRRIDCFFEMPTQRVFDAFEKRVAARGLIRSRRTGERISIQVHDLYVFPEEGSLPTADEVLGILGGKR
jgi:hypothetical protein